MIDFFLSQIKIKDAYFDCGKNRTKLIFRVKGKLLTMYHLHMVRVIKSYNYVKKEFHIGRCTVYIQLRPSQTNAFVRVQKVIDQVLVHV